MTTSFEIMFKLKKKTAMRFLCCLKRYEIGISKLKTVMPGTYTILLPTR